MRRKVLFFVLMLTLIYFAGCVHHHRGSRVNIGFIFVPASIRVTDRVYLHDNHIHDEFCGHPKKWYNGRWVYFYNGRWEYYDYDEGVYYYVPSELIEDEGE